MQQRQHKTMKLKSYFTHGEAKDQAWIVKNRELLEIHQREDMIAHGFLPALDIPTDLSWEYNSEKGTFNFKLDAKGVLVGKKKASQFVGFLASDWLFISEDAVEVVEKELLPA